MKSEPQPPHTDQPGPTDHASTGHDGGVHAGSADGADHDGGVHASRAGRAGHGGDHKAHVDHTGHERMFRDRFWVCLVLSILVLAYSPMIQHWLGFMPPAFPGSAWMVPVFSVIIFLYGGLPFLRMAGPELRQKRPGMMTLISLAISVAFVFSLATLVGDPAEAFFWSKSPTQVLADRAAAVLFYAALAVAALTAIVWTIAVGPGAEAVTRVVTVLVISCPHALGLAVPLVVAITTSLAARNGILVRDRLALEEARNVDVVVFDKTGTLTMGEQGVVAQIAVEPWNADEALALAAAVEGDSEHVVARAFRRASEAHGGALPPVTAFEALKGRGAKATHAGKTVYVGGPRLLELLEIAAPDPIADFATDGGTRGNTVVYLVHDGAVVAAFALADAIRPESRRAIDRLHALGIEVAMLTGDSEDVAQAVADELGIDTYFAQVLPEHKDQKIASLQAQGKRVAMVGDGVNDAPALTRADVGIAIGGGTDVAIESADIVLVRSNPEDVVRIFALSGASYRKMRENLVWASGYNVVALPLAAGILAPWGILLAPAFGALLMSLSTVIVAVNAQLLRRARLD